MNHNINPDLYAALPPDKKEEYKKLFPEPIINYDITPSVLIDDRVPPGYAVFGDNGIKLPEAQTYTSEKSKPIDFEEMKRAIDEVTVKRRDANFIQEFIFRDMFKYYCSAICCIRDLDDSLPQDSNKVSVEYSS
jgi:hypothetical protein